MSKDICEHEVRCWLVSLCSLGLSCYGYTLKGERPPEGYPRFRREEQPEKRMNWTDRDYGDFSLEFEPQEGDMSDDQKHGNYSKNSNNEKLS